MAAEQQKNIPLQALYATVPEEQCPRKQCVTLDTPTNVNY